MENPDDVVFEEDMENIYQYKYKYNYKYKYKYKYKYRCNYLEVSEQKL